MDFDRDWHTFSLDAEVDAYGTSRIAGAHNRLREENARLRAALESWSQAEKGYQCAACYVLTVTLRGPEVEKHFKHPTGDFCVYCRAQWPCEESTPRTYPRPDGNRGLS